MSYVRVVHFIPRNACELLMLWSSSVVNMILLYFVDRYIFKNSKKAGLQELGPRFTLKLRSLQRGTFDSKFGEYEWIHKVSARDVKHT